MSGTLTTAAGGAVEEGAADGAVESLLQGFARKFRRHTLGKIGAVTLIVLYALALLADPLAPATMRWTDKTKSYQPPTRIHFSYLDGGNVVVRPFVFEMHIVNQALRTYGRVPRHTLRVISQETVAGRGDLRAVAMQESAAARASTAVAAFRRHYGLAAGPPGAGRASVTDRGGGARPEPRRAPHRAPRPRACRPRRSRS